MACVHLDSEAHSSIYGLPAVCCCSIATCHTPHMTARTLVIVMVQPLTLLHPLHREAFEPLLLEDGSDLLELVSQADDGGDDGTDYSGFRHGTGRGSGSCNGVMIVSVECVTDPRICRGRKRSTMS